MGHADEMLDNAPKLKKKFKQDKQHDEIQKRIDNLALTVIELIRTVEAIKTVMDNRKSTCNCSKSVDKDVDNTLESSGDCKLESRRDELNRELYERFRKKCSTCKYQYPSDSVWGYYRCRECDSEFSKWIIDYED